MILLNSRVFKKYKVFIKIGEGGFSKVFKVELLNFDLVVKEVYVFKYFVIKFDSDKNVVISCFK